MPNGYGVIVMGFIIEAMTAWDELWKAITVAIVTVVAVAILKIMGKGIRQLGFTLWYWKGWEFIPRQCRKAIDGYRIQKSKSVMLSTVKGPGKWIQIGMRVFEKCLDGEPRKSSRDQLNEIAPVKPSWLNDYYVATALESLSREGKIVKAKRYSFNSWPPKPEYYHFGPIRAGSSAHEEADKIEINDMCLAYQSFRDCPNPARFDSHRFAETISPRETKIEYTYPLKDGVPPCDLCWEEKNRQRDIRTLVDNITKYDLADIALPDIALPELTGVNGELQEAVSDTCIECRCEADANLVKKVIKQAINIRQGQIISCDGSLKYEWRQGEKEELIAALKEYIKHQTSISDLARPLI